MLECPQCHIKYGRKLQCPNYGAAAINHERLKPNQPHSSITNFTGELAATLQTPWQWVNPQFGWVTLPSYCWLYGDISLLMAGWSNKSAVAGVTGTQVIYASQWLYGRLNYASFNPTAAY